MATAGIASSAAGLASPTRFLGLAGACLPWLAGATALLFALGLTLAFQAPEDYRQGVTVRIMYVHVPSAWLAMACYAAMAVSAVGTLVWRHPLADVSIRAAAPIGTAFTALALVTGSLWGKPMWGTWWVWDARLASVFILLVMYLGLIALNRALDGAAFSARVTAVVVLVGTVNLPVIRFSVEWWNTLHQPASVIRAGGPAIHPSMLTPLLTMALAFMALFVTLHLMAMRNEIWRRRVAALRRQAALAAG